MEASWQLNLLLTLSHLLNRFSHTVHIHRFCQIVTPSIKAIYLTSNFLNHPACHFFSFKSSFLKFSSHIPVILLNSPSVEIRPSDSNKRETRSAIIKTRRKVTKWSFVLSRSLVCACVWGEWKQDLGTSNWKAVAYKESKKCSEEGRPVRLNCMELSSV